MTEEERKSFQSLLESLTDEQREMLASEAYYYVIDFANVGGFLSAALAGETASFAQFAGIGRDAIVYESPAAQIGVPKHFVAIDEATRSVVLVIRGTMSISDAMTDLVARQMEFADGVVRACARVRARPRSLALSLVELARVCVALGRLGLSAAVDRQGTLAHATIPAA